MIRVLIVEDSPTVISIFKHMINSEKDMEVVGVAENGKEAIELTTRLKPDLITMDIEMPVMNGLEATRIIMSQNPTPIVVISSTVSDESIKAIFHFLEAGALTALAKPADIFSPSFEETKKYMINTLRAMASINVAKKPLKQPFLKTIPFQPKTDHYEIIAIGASVGGPLALKSILSKLPVDFPVPIVVVQHISKGFTAGYVKWLGENTPLKVKIAENYEILQKGTVYVAPEMRHLEIERIDGNLAARVIVGEPVSDFYPSITVLLKSVSKVSGKNAIGMLLTGMGGDGAQGLLELKRAKGCTIVQDPDSAVVFGMASVAQSLGAVDQVVEIDHMAAYLTKLIKQNYTR